MENNEHICVENDDYDGKYHPVIFPLLRIHKHSTEEKKLSFEMLKSVICCCKRQGTSQWFWTWPEIQNHKLTINRFFLNNFGLYFSCLKVLQNMNAITISKFYQKVGVISWSLFHLIWKNCEFFTQISSFRLKKFQFSVQLCGWGQVRDKVNVEFEGDKRSSSISRGSWHCQHKLTEFSVSYL